ncbi:MAG: hypothetical protein IKP10_05510 [Clostridia bacterium]|nr:hypothetical protein [Clostridia bacterium]
MKAGGKWRSRLSREMIRPFVYMTFTRFILALTAALLADFFLRPAVGRDLRESAFLLFAILFVLLGLIAWLRLDGMKLPRLMMLRINPRKKPSRMYGDIADHLDDEPGPTFDELDDEEKDICILGADAVCAVLFLIAALIV